MAALKSLVSITSPGSIVMQEQESKFDRKERIRQQMREQGLPIVGEAKKEEETKVEEEKAVAAAAPMEEEK